MDVQSPLYLLHHHIKHSLGVYATIIKIECDFIHNILYCSTVEIAMPCFHERQAGDVVEGGEDGGGAKMDGGGCSAFAMRSDRSATGE